MRSRCAGVPTAVLALLLAAMATAFTANRKFYSDDPIAREPETEDASGAQPWDIDLAYDLTYNMFVTQRRPPSNVRAQNINTIDEVPDSSWFTNRMGARVLTLDEIMRGPETGAPPDASRWTITREKSSGFAPGFTAGDARGQTWFVYFDPPTNPEGATGAIAVATKIFWALGYNQVDNRITIVRRPDLQVAPTATIRRPSGARTPFTADDLNAVFERAARNTDGSYRVAVGRLLPGKVLGGFKYEGTRPDDPNDIVPHQHRRELRALRVFGAWTNLTDMKADNTLDTLVTENGRGLVRHYLQDVGSTFGMGANGPHDPDDGWEYMYQGGPALRRVLTFGFSLSPWQTLHYVRHPAVGRFEGDTFDPETWKPHFATAAYIEMRADDAFWAARRVMAFSDELIRGIVKAGAFSDPAAERLLGDVLIKRRDRIGRVYLTAINPIVDVTLDASGSLRFGNAAVQYGFAEAPRGYTAAWHALDNTTGEARRIGETTGATGTIQAPTGLPSAAGAFVRVDISADAPAQAAWSKPVHAYFTRQASGWKLVGFERLPEPR